MPSKEYENKRQRARQRALRQLAQRHPNEFEQILYNEYEAEGIQRQSGPFSDYRKAQEALARQLDRYAKLRARRIDGRTIEQVMNITPPERAELFKRYRNGEHRMTPDQLIVEIGR